MLQQILHITGLDRKLETLKHKLEHQANQAIGHVKSVAIQFAVAAALGTAAAIFALMTLVTGLVAMFAWLQPAYGTLIAIGSVAAVLASITLILSLSAIAIAKKEPSSFETPEFVEVGEPNDSETPPIPRAARAEHPSAYSRLSSPEVINSIFGVVGHLTRSARTGIGPVDNVIRAIEPEAELATKEAVARAARLVQTGDRKTMFAILGTAAALGWLAAKVSDRSSPVVINAKAEA
jgi:hypothetical protein